MYRFGRTVFNGFLAGLLMFAIGCGESAKKGKGLTLHFVFKDAKGITVGNKVMADGVFVGQVIAPPESPKPKCVLVSVRIDKLTPEKMAYMTTNVTAEIKKDSLVTGEVKMDLIFPKEPGPQVADGTILNGYNGFGGLMDITDLGHIKIPQDSTELVERLKTTFVSGDPATVGATVFYLNWTSMVVGIFVIVALILDLLIRLPQGSVRDRSSPGILRNFWMLFCLVLVVRFFVCVCRVLGSQGIINREILQTLRIGISDVGELLIQEWPFWILVIVLITMRFKFDLLTSVKKG